MATTNRTAKPNVKPPIVKSKSIASKSSKTASEAGRTDKFELASVRSQIDAIRKLRRMLTDLQSVEAMESDPYGGLK